MDVQNSNISMSRKKDSLKKELDQISEIILFAKESIEIVDFLSTKSSDSHETDEKIINEYFFYSKVTAWRIFCIELCKLFVNQDNEKFNFHKLLNKLQPGGIYNSLMANSDIVQNWTDKLNSLSDQFNQLKLQRDKVYAHTDKDSFLHKNKITISDAKSLLSLAIEITSTLYERIDNAHFHFALTNSPSVNLKEIVKRLGNESKVRNELLRREGEKYGLS